MASSPLFPIRLILRRQPATSGPPRAALDLFEAELCSRLKADPGLAPLIEGRLYPLIIPEQPRPTKSGKAKTRLPAITYQITGNDRLRYIKGPAGMATATVALYCRSTRYSEAKAIRESLRRFDGFAGMLAQDVNIIMTWFLDQSDEFEWPAGLGTDRGTYDEILGFRFKYREPMAEL